MRPYTLIFGHQSGFFDVHVVDAESELEARRQRHETTPAFTGEVLCIPEVNALAAPQMLLTLREVEYWLLDGSHLNKQELLQAVQEAVAKGANLS